MNKSKLTIGILVLFLLISSTTLITTAIKTNSRLETNEMIVKISNNDDFQKEHWALIIGVGIYYDHPEKEIASIIDAENMYNALTSNEHWKDDHIKVISGENATKINIIKGLCWLDKMEDENDISLVYISTHGWHLNLKGIPIDLPPFDEKDRSDEILTTYYGFKNPFANLRDDELNFFLSRLESQGICVIIDSCHSGGFNDPPRKAILGENLPFFSKFRKNSNEGLMEGFSEEIKKDGRVILMATREDEVGWCVPGVGGCFTTVLLESLEGGFGDFNNNGLISAEEIFNYTKTKMEPDDWASQHPTIYDGYEGELHLTYAKYKVDFFDDFESANKGWTTIDHTCGIGGDLWHITENSCISPTHCWNLVDENTGQYNNNMNNSLISPIMELGEKPVITFNIKGSKEYYDKIYLEVTTDNWTTYKTKKLTPRCSSWKNEEITQDYYPYWDLSGQIIQMRFRFESDENIPFNLDDGKGYTLIDDMQIYSELMEV